VFAHRLDEYLQATLVAIEPSGVRLQIHLTPGVAVAEQVLVLIDRNRDGTISPREAATYAEVLKHALTLRLDRITRQKRNNTQSTDEVAFTIHPAACHYPASSQRETYSAHSYGTSMLPSFVASSPFSTNSKLGVVRISSQRTPISSAGRRRSCRR